MKKYQTLLSQRYLRSRAVNFVAIVAVMLGVTALIIVSSVMDGFAHDIQERIRGIMSHIIIEGEQLTGIDDYEELIRRVEQVPEVAACSPLVECPFVLVRSGKRTRYGQLRGIDLEREKRTSKIVEYGARVWNWMRDYEAALRSDPEGKKLRRRKTAREIRYDAAKYQVARRLARPELDFQPMPWQDADKPGALVGIDLAVWLGLAAPQWPGRPRPQTFSITSPTIMLTFQAQDLEAVGVFESRHYAYDSQLLYVSLETAQDLLGLADRVTSVSVRLHDERTMDVARDKIERAIRNETPLVNLADAADVKRLRTRGGTHSVRREKGRTWLRVEPSGTGQSAAATLVLPDADRAYARAGEPTRLAFEWRPAAVPRAGDLPWIEVAFVARVGDREVRYRTDAGRFGWLPAEPGKADAVREQCELVNFTTADGLDVLVPKTVVRAEITVHGGPVEFSHFRFEDGRPIRVIPWRKKQENFLRAIDLERAIQVIIMALMVVIAGFSIMAILWLMVKEKTRDIGVLMALGATRRGIVAIFLLNGFLIGAIGAALGLAAGWILSVNLNWIEDQVDLLFGWRLFSPDIYYLDKLPHRESPAQFILMAVLAMLVSLAAAVWPAVKAARLDPVEALRYE